MEAAGDASLLKLIASLETVGSADIAFVALVGVDTVVGGDSHLGCADEQAVGKSVGELVPEIVDCIASWELRPGFQVPFFLILVEFVFHFQFPWLAIIPETSPLFVRHILDLIAHVVSWTHSLNPFFVALDRRLF